MSAVARVTSIISEERVEFVFANEDQGSGGPGFKSRCFQVYICDIWVPATQLPEGGVLPIMAYTGRLRPKGVPFSGVRCMKG